MLPGIIQTIGYFGKTFKNKSSMTGLLCLTVLLFNVSFQLSAQGNLLVTPRRIVFENNRRSHDLNLANIGSDTATYSITLVQIRMKEDGSFETITTPDPGQNFADQNIRYFPRNVTLPPNEAQVVKVQVLRTNQLAPGEYRSHFYFRSVPKAKPLGTEEPAVDSTRISVQIIPIFGITIPVIIRIGESATKVTITDPAIQIIPDGTPVLSLRLNRTGNFSVYGDLAIDHVSPQGIVTVVGNANGLAVYTPNSTRRFQMKLNRVSGVDFNSGKLIIRYSSPSDVKPEKYAEVEFTLP